MPPPCHPSSQKVRFSNGAGDVKCAAVAYSGFNECHVRIDSKRSSDGSRWTPITPVERLGSLWKAKLCTELYREGQRWQTAWAAIRRTLVPPRHGRTIATFVGGSSVLLLFAHALFHQRFDWLA